MVEKELQKKAKSCFVEGSVTNWLDLLELIY